MYLLNEKSYLSLQILGDENLAQISRNIDQMLDSSLSSHSPSVSNRKSGFIILYFFLIYNLFCLDQTINDLAKNSILRKSTSQSNLIHNPFFDRPSSTSLHRTSLEIEDDKNIEIRTDKGRFTEDLDLIHINKETDNNKQLSDLYTKIPSKTNLKRTYTVSITNSKKILEEEEKRNKEENKSHYSLGIHLDFDTDSSNNEFLDYYLKKIETENKSPNQEDAYNDTDEDYQNGQSTLEMMPNQHRLFRVIISASFLFI
jgi:hypothetical protein